MPLSLPALSPYLWAYSHNCISSPDHGLQLIPASPDCHPSWLAIAPPTQEPTQLGQLPEETTNGQCRRGSQLSHGLQCIDVLEGEHLCRGPLRRRPRLPLQLVQPNRC